MKIKLLLLSMTTLISYASFSQIAGNEMYGNVNYNQYNNYNSYAQQHGPVQQNSINDSTFFLQVKVLMNVQADEYVATIAVQQEAMTIKECNTQINKRIENFKKSLALLGIKGDDIYVDMVAQAKIFDFNLEGKTATQVEKGFELKKNVIFSFKDPTMIDDIMVYASEEEIYDLVKVDYIVTDQQKIYDQMVQEVDKLLDKKKANALQLSEMTILPDSKLASQNFYTIYPDQSYKNYQAFETSDANYYQGYNSGSSYWKKEIRKSKTFYFAKQNYSGFDKVISPVNVRIPVQFVLDVQVKYTLKCDHCKSQQPKKVETNKTDKK